MTTIGVIWDNYTSAVESQLTRDLIALKQAYPREDIACRTQNTNDPASLLKALNIELVFEGRPDLYVVYKTGEFWPEHPDENSHTVILRDLYVSQAEFQVSGEPSQSYHVPPYQGRFIREQNPLYKVGPRGKGPIDPAIILLWGGGVRYDRYQHQDL